MKTTKTLLNTLFLTMALTGTVVILRFNGLDGPSVRAYPLIILAVYALVLMKALGGFTDYSLAEKKINTFYYLGILFTAAAFLSLFVHLRERAAFMGPEEAAAMALSFLFIAITVSLASLVLRCLAWRLFMPRFREESAAELQFHFDREIPA